MHSHNMEHHQRFNDMQERFEQRLVEETSRLRETAQREHTLELSAFREEAEDARRENQEMRRQKEDLMASVNRLTRETREQNNRNHHRSSRPAQSSPRRSRREDRNRNDPERVQARAARSERRRRDEEREEARRQEEIEREQERERERAREREREMQRQREIEEAREQERVAERRRQQRRESELQQERDRLRHLEEERARQREQRERERAQAREAERRREANQGFMPEDTENFPPRSASPANSRRPSQRDAQNLNQSLEEVTSQAGSRAGSQRGSRREPRPHLPSANVPTYNGATACDDWLETVENMVRAYHWNEEVLRSALSGAFTAKVKNYLRSCGLTDMSSFPDIKRQLLIRYGAHRNIDAIQKRFQHLSQYDGEKAEEYFDRVISERMAGWKNEPTEERDRQAITRFIYTVKHMPLSDYLELKRRDFELIGQRMDQAKF